ncbi:response regulator [Legionella spiritensis]|uniref:Two-component response regulator n=1 Tax=Legionella spiritensis TaxID=452 RepID=A0A0W0YWV3_LEGSP|nr:response regulator [Legionella spiritensis]KTD61397.1 two-component response regulator [Legionella spiritensis]SNV33547.1 two-component response regulator [Legionella spiritensis]
MELQECNRDILYIEDDVIDIQGTQRELKKVNDIFSIEVALDGEDALNKLYGRNGEQKIYPKVILLDINLPKMNGIDLLKTIRSDPALAETEVFVLTGTCIKADKLKMKGLNIKGHIVKPLGYGDALNVFWATQHM